MILRTLFDIKLCQFRGPQVKRRYKSLNRTKNPPHIQDNTKKINLKLSGIIFFGN